MEKCGLILKTAFEEYLRPKEYHSLLVANDCLKRQTTAKLFGDQERILEINHERRAAAEFVHDERLTVLHMWVNLMEQPFQPGTVEVGLISINMARRAFRRTHNSRTTSWTADSCIMHMLLLINVAGTCMYEAYDVTTNALQVVLAFAEAELHFSTKVRHDFERQYNEMKHICAVLTQNATGTLRPNYMQVGIIFKLTSCDIE